MFEKFQALMNFIRDIAWPVAIIIIVYYFSSPLANILQSMNHAVSQGGVKLTSSGVEIVANQSEAEDIHEFIEHPRSYKEVFYLNKAEAIQDPLLSKKDTADTLLNEHQQSLVEDVNQQISRFLANAGTNRPRDEILQNLLCDAYICLYFERTFQRILGSQIKLLQKLEEAPDKFISQRESYDIFTTTLPSNAQIQASFRKWLKFLEGSRLIRVSEADRIYLTEEGKEFLKYIYERKYPLLKPA